MGPLVSNKAANSVLSFQDYLKTRGATQILSCNRLDQLKPFLTPGIWDVRHISSREDIECFGPLLQVIWVDTFEQALVESNNTKYGLSASIFTDQKDHYDVFWKEAVAGLINWNCATTGAASSAPFGGVGYSGNFRPSAYYAADYCSYPVASLEVDGPGEENLPGVFL